jgi:glycosyltransferase involved in cell wall biosynthesis
MRVLHVNDSLEPIGGIEVYVENMGKLLKENEHCVEYLGNNKKDNKKGLIGWLLRIYNPISYFRMIKKIKEFKPDIIHYHSLLYLISPSVMHAAKIMKIPSVITIHDYSIICPNSYFLDDLELPCKHGFSTKCLTQNCWPYRPGLKPKILRIYRTIKLITHRWIIKNNTDAFLSPSHNLAQNLKKYLGKNAIITPLFTDFTPNYTPLNEENTLLFVGRIAPEKGIKSLIDAMKHVKKEIPDTKLIVVGKGKYLNKYIQYAKSLGLSPNIYFKGYVDRKQLPELYQISKIVVIPSIYAENFGTVGLEAISFGRPIIVSNSFGLIERIHDGKIGKAFKSGNSKELASLIITMLKDSDSLNQLSINTKKVIKEYSKKRHYNQIIEIYRDTIKKYN